MNILYAITSLEGGGAQNLLADLCEVLKKDNKLTVVFFRDRRKYLDSFNGIEVIFIDIKKYGILFAIKKLIKIIREKNIEIVHTHLLLADIIGRTAGLVSKTDKIFSTLHREDEWRTKKKYFLIRLFNRITVNCFKNVRLIAVSNSVKNHCIKYERISKKKIEVIYNFIKLDNPVKSDPDFISDFKDEFIILTAARLEPEKEHIVILKALQKLPENIKILVLGEGSLRENLERYAKENNINAEFLGFRKNIYDYLRVSDLFILSSKSEGQSIAILEAFYCFVPVIASDIPANDELLSSGKYGTLFRTGDCDDLAAKINEFKKHDSITKEAYEYCISLSMENHIDKLMKIYILFNN